MKNPKGYVKFILLQKRTWGIIRSFYDLPLADFLLTYFVIMNFILAVPAVIFGLFLYGAVVYFEFYTIIMFLSFLFVLVKIGRNFSEGIRLLLMWSRNPKKVLTFSVILLWSVYIVLITLYTPLFINWDAITMYLPMAKAMQTTGSLLFSPFYLSDARMGHPPLFPILYAFTMSTFGDFCVKLVPIVYFLFLLILIFKAGSDFFGKDVAVLSVFLFLVMPSTITYFGDNNLYLDLGFTFYLMASIYFLLKCTRDCEKRNFWCALLGMASGLLFMSKEFGTFLFFVILSLFLFNFVGIAKNLYIKTFLATSLSFFPYLFLSAWDILTRLGNVDSYYYIRSILILLFFLGYFIVFAFYNKKLSSNHINGALSKFLLFLIPAGLSMIYMVFNILVRGQVSPIWQFAIESKLASDGIFLPLSTNLDNITWNFFNVYNFFIAFPMVLVVVPLVAGLLMFCYNMRKGKLTHEAWIFSLFFLYLFFMWGFNGFPIGGDTYRYIIPLILVAFFLTMTDFTNFPFFARKSYEDKEVKHQFQFFLISLAFIYTWFTVDPPHPRLLYNRVVNVQPSATLFDLLIFIVIFSPYLIPRIRSIATTDRRTILQLPIPTRKPKSDLIKKLFFLVLAINISLPVYLLCRSSTIISSYTWDPAYYAQLNSIEAFYHEPLIEIADFYSTNINNSYVTVSFHMQRLAYLMKRPLIDLEWADQVYLLSPVLKSNNQTEIVERLVERNIRYFLLPNLGHYAYPMYSYYYSNFKLFRIVEHQRFERVNGEVFYFILLKEFTDAKVALYELKSLT
jgi:hypothetical protein